MIEVSLRNGKRDLTSSQALMENLQTWKSWVYGEAREISPVPRLSWKICKHERGESMKRQERSHQFLGSQERAANIIELTLRNGKRDLTSSWALTEQLQTWKSWVQGTAREISPVPGLSWNSWKHETIWGVTGEACSAELNIGQTEVKIPKERKKSHRSI